MATPALSIRHRLVHHRPQKRSILSGMHGMTIITAGTYWITVMFVFEFRLVDIVAFLTEGVLSFVEQCREGGPVGRMACTASL
jgi:hypothetical protein